MNEHSRSYRKPKNWIFYAKIRRKAPTSKQTQQYMSNYSEMTVAQLKEILSERELKVGGKKNELIARLEAHDEENKPQKKSKKSKAQVCVGSNDEKSKKSKAQVCVESNDDASTEAVNGETDYNKMKISELKELLAERELKVGGKKAELIERLIEWDMENSSSKKTTATSKIIETVQVTLAFRTECYKDFLNIQNAIYQKVEASMDPSSKARFCLSGFKCEQQSLMGHPIADFDITDFKVRVFIREGEVKEMSVYLALTEVTEAIKTVPDSHVALESLNMQTDYTGERDEAFLQFLQKANKKAIKKYIEKV